MTVRTILVATDLSTEGRPTADWGIELARRLGAKVILTNVFDIPVPPVPDASFTIDAATVTTITEQCQSLLDAEVARLRDRGVPVVSLLRQGDARVLLPLIAQEASADLLVMGVHGRSRLARFLLGSVAEAVVRTSPVPVVVVPSAPTPA